MPKVQNGTGAGDNMSFEGEIGEIDLIERLVELGSEQFTGAIRFESDGIIKIVYFKGGDVLSASTNDRTDAIDEILLRANKVTREHLKQALAKRKESETLGDALLGLGFITRKELTWARRVQVIGVIRSIIAWSTGSYTIVADYLPKREEGTLFSLSQIIVELIVTDNDRSKSEQAMDSGNAVFSKSPEFEDAFRRLGLNEDAEQIAAQIDGHLSAGEVASRSGKDTFNVYKLLEALRRLRLVTRGGKPPAEHEVSVAAPAVETWEVENPEFTLDDVSPAPTHDPEPASEWAPAEGETLEIPSMAAAWETAQPEPPAPSRSVWDEPANDEQFSGTEIAPAHPMPVAQSVPASGEPQWGFDEAQIEAARRAEVPVQAKQNAPSSIIGKTKVARTPGKPRTRTGMWVLLLIVIVAAAAAYPAWQWWQGRNVPEPVVVVRHPKVRNAVARPAGLTASTPPAAIATATTPATTTMSVATFHSVPPTSTMATSSLRPERSTRGAKLTEPATSTATHLERTTNGVSMTNTPPASATSDAMRTKYDGMARDFAGQKGGNYTVQFELVCETASITRALTEAGDKVWFLTTSYHGRACYRVFWGRYETSAEAITASKQLPRGLGAMPVVVKIPR
jgi:hypothetical protein